jgi:hypothetical protein
VGTIKPKTGALPSLKFAKGSLKLWQGVKARAVKRTHLADGKIKLRQQQIKELEAKRAAGPTVMYDSVDVGQIPADAPAVAGYVAGRFHTFPELEARFPRARRLSIAVASTQDADCLDIEPGDSRPELAPGWVKRQHARGVKRPVVYASQSEMTAVVAALTAAGIPRSGYRIWSAHFTFRPHICSPAACGARGFTADATQWTDRALGRTLDQSLLHAGFWQ